MLPSRHAIKGLHALGIIAAHSRHQPIPSTTLARHIGLCLSSTEMVIRKLRTGGLVHSLRGPGGGHQLKQDVEHLSVWDVVSCFNADELSNRAEANSPEREAANGLAARLGTAIRDSLQAYRLIDVIKRLPEDETNNDDSNESSTTFYLKPLRPIGPPLAPSSVFDLANFTNAVRSQENA